MPVLNTYYSAAPNDMKNSALQSRSPVRARGSGRRGRYKIPLTVPSLPIFDHTPEEVARYTRAGFVPFSSSVTPYAHSAPDSSSASIQELDGHAANLTMINGLDDFRIVNSHVISREQDDSAAISIASSIQELHGGITNSHVVSDRQDDSASLSIASSIHGTPYCTEFTSAPHVCFNQDPPHIRTVPATCPTCGMLSLTDRIVLLCFPSLHRSLVRLL